MKVMSRRGRPRWPSSDRAADRADAAGGEDEPEVGGAAVQVVLDDVGQQHLGRAHEQQVGDRGGGERRPQPHVAADVAQAVAHVARDAAARRGDGAARGRRHRQQRDAPRRRTTRASSAKAVPAPSTSMSTPPSAGPARRSAIGRTNWSSALACGELAGGQDLGHDRVEGGAEERRARAVDARRARRCATARARRSSESSAMQPDGDAAQRRRRRA